MALLMFPIGHLTVLFVQQVRKDIASVKASAQASKQAAAIATEAMEAAQSGGTPATPAGKSFEP